MYEFPCPHCRGRLRQKTEEHVGRKTKCPRCEAVLAIPPEGKRAKLLRPGNSLKTSQSDGAPPPRPKRTKTAAAPPPASSDSDAFLDALDEFEEPAAELPPVVTGKKTAAQPLRPSLEHQDYEVRETAEDRMARLGATETAMDNIIARRLFFIGLSTFFLFVGLRVLRGCLWFVPMLMTKDLDDYEPSEWTEDDWEVERELLVDWYGQEWTDANFDEYKRIMLDDSIEDFPEGFFPDEEDERR